MKNPGDIHCAACLDVSRVRSLLHSSAAPLFHRPLTSYTSTSSWFLRVPQIRRRSGSCRILCVLKNFVILCAKTSWNFVILLLYGVAGILILIPLLLFPLFQLSPPQPAQMKNPESIRCAACLDVSRVRSSLHSSAAPLFHRPLTSCTSTSSWFLRVPQIRRRSGSCRILCVLKNFVILCAKTSWDSVILLLYGVAGILILIPPLATPLFYLSQVVISFLIKLRSKYRCPISAPTIKTTEE